MVWTTDEGGSNADKSDLERSEDGRRGPHFGSGANRTG